MNYLGIITLSTLLISSQVWAREEVFINAHLSESTGQVLNFNDTFSKATSVKSSFDCIQSSELSGLYILFYGDYGQTSFSLGFTGWESVPLGTTLSSKSYHLEAPSIPNEYDFGLKIRGKNLGNTAIQNAVGVVSTCDVVASVNDGGILSLSYSCKHIRTTSSSTLDGTVKGSLNCKLQTK